MKSRRLVLATIALALFGTQAAMAQKTRAEVKAECDAARKAGKIVEGECQPEKPSKATSNTTRAEVKKEAAAANKKGETTKGEKP